MVVPPSNILSRKLSPSRTMELKAFLGFRGVEYYFNKRSRQCKGFHYTGCGKSGNNFLSKEECHEKCEKRYPRSVVIPPTPAAARGKGKKKPVPSGYSGKKPVELVTMLRHIVLDGVNQTYYKSDAEWADYGLCLGYRF
ncbi:Kunitz/Bovine pancreatic trypsin inhibitor domain protein, partial [Ostertagia ostertagi]